MDSIKDNIPQETKDQIEQTANKIKEFNEKVFDPNQTEYSNVVSVLQDIVSKLELLKTGKTDESV